MSDLRDEPEDATPSFVDVDPERDERDAETVDGATRGRGILKSTAVIGGRVVTGVVAVAIAAATIAAATLLPLPTVRTAAPSRLVTPVATAQQLVCPGGLLRLADASGNGATVASSLGSAAVTTGSSTGTVDVKAIASSAKGVSGSEAPQLLSTPPVAGSTSQTLLAGAQAQSLATPEFVGLASAGCAAASGDSWLVGGATTTGRTTLLTIANPSDVPATVTIEIYGENGKITAPGMNGIVIVARGQRVLSLAGFAPGLASPVVHVTSRGGQIVANLQQSIVRGITPGGVDVVGAQSEPSRVSVIPGLVIRGSAALGTKLGLDGYDDLQTVLRLFLPGTVGATANVSIIPENGSKAGQAFETTLEPGKVTDFPIDELDDGEYTAVVTTDIPIAAAARVSAIGAATTGAHTDFAWLASAPDLRSSALVSVPLGLSPSLHLYNPTDKDAAVTLHSLAGTDTTLTVKAGASTAAPVVSGTTYQLEGASQLYASVVGLTDGGIAGYSVAPAERGSTPIRIYG
jgi:hypothetical protein